jgi:uncharacterized protein (DUF983 family)
MKHPLLIMVGRGFNRRCPVCGKGRIFSRWTALVRECPECGIPLASREGDIYFIYYVTIALITGFFLIAAILVLLNQPFYQRFKPLIWTVLLAGLFGSIMGTARRRKGVAVAIDCWLEGRRPL